MADVWHAARRALIGALLAAGGAFAAPPGTPLPPGPPFSPNAKPPHRIVVSIDTAPSRDVLTLLSAEAGAPAALRRLRASTAVRAVAKSESVGLEDLFGRLVAAAAGTPDPLLASYKSRARYFAALLDEMEREGSASGAVLAFRVAQLLPDAPVVEARVVVVPFLGIAGYGEVTSVREDDTLYFVADLPRLTGDVLAAPQPREALLKVLRAVGSEAWRTLFREHFEKPPAWGDRRAGSFDALLMRTIAEGPATVFLFADEFFPLDPFLGEPIERAFRRWNQTAETLLDPKTKEVQGRDLVTASTRGDFWGRFAAIVGAQITDLLLREAGRETFLQALAAGPRAVANLYAARVKGTKHPDFSKAVRKALEEKKP